MFGRLVIIVLAALVMWAVFARPSDASRPEQPYVVRPTDTLWTIAATRYGDPREGIWEIRKRNGLDGTLILPGQVLTLP